jgi:hypothetical protein
MDRPSRDGDDIYHSRRSSIKTQSAPPGFPARSYRSEPSGTAGLENLSARRFRARDAAPRRRHAEAKKKTCPLRRLLVRVRRGAIREGAAKHFRRFSRSGAWRRGDRARLKVHDWKSCVPLKRVPGVQIPPSPPYRDARSRPVRAFEFGCRLLMAGSCARRNREPRQVRKEAAVAEEPLCHREAWLSAMGIREAARSGRLPAPGLALLPGPES